MARDQRHPWRDGCQRRKLRRKRVVSVSAAAALLVYPGSVGLGFAASGSGAPERPPSTTSVSPSAVACAAAAGAAEDGEGAGYSLALATRGGPSYEVAKYWDSLGDLDAYAVLGVKFTASKTMIRKAFVNLCRTEHPDLNGGKESQMWILGNEAYRILSTQKAKYDTRRGIQTVAVAAGGFWKFASALAKAANVVAPSVVSVAEAGAQFASRSVKKASNSIGTRWRRAASKFVLPPPAAATSMEEEAPPASTAVEEEAPPASTAVEEAPPAQTPVAEEVEESVSATAPESSPVAAPSGVTEEAQGGEPNAPEETSLRRILEELQVLPRQVAKAPESSPVAAPSGVTEDAQGGEPNVPEETSLRRILEELQVLPRQVAKAAGAVQASPAPAPAPAAVNGASPESPRNEPQSQVKAPLRNEPQSQVKAPTQENGARSSSNRRFMFRASEKMNKVLAKDRREAEKKKGARKRSSFFKGKRH